MVEKVNYSHMESTIEVCADIGSHTENRRLYYECLREQKNKQKNLIDISDDMNMPLDCSDYNAMFMMF